MKGIRFLALLGFATLITYLLHPMDTLSVYAIVLGVGIGLYGLEYFLIQQRLLKRPPLSDPQGKIIWMADARRKKQNKRKQNTTWRENRFATVFETHFVPEADIVAGILEQHGIETHVLNRQNATVLPTTEWVVKVLVPQSEKERALQLIHGNTSQQR